MTLGSHQTIVYIVNEGTSSQPTGTLKRYDVVTGGKTEAYAFGINWYLNVNTYLRFEYLHQNVFGGGPNPDGVIDGFGVRTQFFF